MKKKRMFLSIGIILFTALCITMILNTNKEAYTLNRLKDESDYTVIASREITKCEETASAYVMNGYVGKKPYKENGKVYTEMYLCCSCYNTLGDKITIVTDGYYFRKKDFYFLFLKCLDKENGLYSPVNGKTGIIKAKKELTPMDNALKKELKNSFADYYEFLDWFTTICEEKTKTIKETTTQSTEQNSNLSTTSRYG